MEKSQKGEAGKDLRDKIRGLAVLWDDYLHLVVGPHVDVDNGDGFKTLKRLRGKGKGKGPDGKPLISLMRAGSATQLIAKALLDTKDLKDYEVADSREFKDAAQALIDRRIDAAFVLSGLPNPVVERALGGGCRLLRIDGESWGHGPELQEPKGTRTHLVDLLKKAPIPPRTYPKQGESEIPTLGGSTILAASNSDRKRFGDEEAEAILRAIFDAPGGKIGLETLVEHHEAAQEIRLLKNLREYQTPTNDRDKMFVEFHPGAASFFEGEAEKLKIAAGPVGETSFRLGVAIVDSLKRRGGLLARVLNTDGSKESRDLLKAGDAHLAIVQNDVAVDSYDQGMDIHLVSFLYPDVFHFVVRGSDPTKGPISLRDFLTSPQRRKVALVRNSGDLDERILRHYARIVEKSDPEFVWLPLSLVQNRLISGDIEAALFSSGIPMGALGPLLRPDPGTQVPRLRRAGQDRDGRHFSGVRVLPLDVPQAGQENPGPRDSPPEVPSILGLTANEPFLSPSTIPPETYPPSQKDRNGTVAVQTILACRKDTAHVYNITRTVIEDEVRLRREVRGLNLRDPLERGDPSVPIHKDALRYYRANNFVVRLPEPERTWSEAAFNYLIQQLPGFFAGFLSAVIIPLLSTRAKDTLQRCLKDKLTRLSERATMIYVSRTIPPDQKPGKLTMLWDEIVGKFEKGELQAKDVSRLDRYIRECRERLAPPAPPGA